MGYINPKGAEWSKWDLHVRFITTNNCSLTRNILLKIFIFI